LSFTSVHFLEAADHDKGVQQAVTPDSFLLTNLFRTAGAQDAY
jgi:hypothetical protein